MFFNYVNAIELIHVPTTWNYSPTNCLVPVAPALEAVPLGGDGYASGFSGDDGTGLQLMGGPFRGTSRRNFINSYGNVFLQWIQSSNCMFSRCLETKW